jgi:hypothetical protein
MKPQTIEELNALIAEDHGHLIKDHLLTMSAKRRGQTLSEEARGNLSAARRGLYTEAQRAACRERMASPTPAMLEARRKARTASLEARKGRALPEETKAKIRAAWQRRRAGKA